MNIQSIFPNIYWPIPKIEELQDIQLKIQRLVDYFQTNEQIEKFNTFMYGQLKDTITKWKPLNKNITSISNNLWNMINTPEEK